LNSFEVEDKTLKSSLINMTTSLIDDIAFLNVEVKANLQFTRLRIKSLQDLQKGKMNQLRLNVTSADTGRNFENWIHGIIEPFSDNLKIQKLRYNI